MSDATPGPGHHHGGGHGHEPGPGEGDGTPPVLDEAFWEERYASSRALWSGDPNPQLVAEAEGLTPGRALDVGCGEGRDAIWLAGRGWEVTGIDISTTALARARGHAEEAGADVASRTEWAWADITTYDPGDALFDLVSVQYVHLPSALRDDVHRRLARAVAPGGILLIATHDRSDLDTTVGRPPFPDFFATAREVADALPAEAWEVLVADTRPRTATDPEGRQVTVHDAVTVARRRTIPV